MGSVTLATHCGHAIHAHLARATIGTSPADDPNGD
jgi:hypothetical protein